CLVDFRPRRNIALLNGKIQIDKIGVRLRVHRRRHIDDRSGRYLLIDRVAGDVSRLDVDILTDLDSAFLPVPHHHLGACDNFAEVIWPEELYESSDVCEWEGRRRNKCADGVTPRDPLGGSPPPAATGYLRGRHRRRRIAAGNP